MNRIWQFWRELSILWRAFQAPETPLWLKALMLVVPAYLLMPLDFIPDFIPVLGWLDDAVIIPLLVSWLVTLLPQRASEARRRDNRGGRTIDGTARRM